MTENRVHDDGHSQNEQEGVSLDIAGLDQAQGSAHCFSGSMSASNKETRDDPLIEPIGQPSQAFVGESDKLGVNLIEVEPVAQGARQGWQLLRKQVAGRAGIQSVADGKTE